MEEISGSWHRVSRVFSSTCFFARPQLFQTPSTRASPSLEPQGFGLQGEKFGFQCFPSRPSPTSDDDPDIVMSLPSASRGFLSACGNLFSGRRGVLCSGMTALFGCVPTRHVLGAFLSNLPYNMFNARCCYTYTVSELQCPHRESYVVYTMRCFSHVFSVNCFLLVIHLGVLIFGQTQSSIHCLIWSA